MICFHRINWMLLIGLCLMACAAEPDFFDIEGRKVELDNPSGGLLLVNYWAEWCKPCLEEIPELNALAAEHGEKISVIGVCFDALTPEQLAAQALQLGIKYPVLTSDPALYLNIATPEVLPTSYLLDANHKLIKVFVGPQTANGILQVANAR